MSQQNILNNRVILNAIDVEFSEDKNLNISNAAK